MIELSERTRQIIEVIFQNEVKEEAMHSIQYECAQNLHLGMGADFGTT